MNTRTLNKSAGLTLVELMVAMTLALILMAGVIQLFVANKESYQLSEEVGYIQEGARFAMYQMGRDIRMAGYLGCNSRNRDALVVNVTFPRNAAVDDVFNPEEGIQGWEADDTDYGDNANPYVPVEGGTTLSAAASGGGWETTARDASDSGDAAVQTNMQTFANSDILRVWTVREGPVFLNDLDPAAPELELSGDLGLSAGETILITDCETADVVRVCAVAAGAGGAYDVTTSGCGVPANSGTILNKKGAHVYRLAARTYFVGRRSNSTGTDASGNPYAATLYVREDSDPADMAAAAGAISAATPLLEGVESLQLRYGEDTSADPDGVADLYVAADAVSDWNNVVSVVAELMVQSARDDVVDAEQTLTFNGVTDIAAPDKRLRFPFVFTTSLRNRSQ